MLYDFFAMTYFGLLDLGMIIHHSLPIIGFYSAIINNTPLNLLLPMILWFEVSNPSMHLRMIIKYCGFRYTLLYEFLEIQYIVFYMIGRLLMGTIAEFRILICPEFNYIIYLSAIGLALFSYYYIFRMI